MRRLIRIRTASRAKLVAVLSSLFAAAALASAPSAGAEYFFTERGAERVTKDAVSSHYEDTAYEDVIPSCRPQGQRRADRRYKYHRWVCAFAIRGDEYEFCDNPDEELFGGQFRIVGQRGRGRYSYKVLRGLHCF